MTWPGSWILLEGGGSHTWATLTTDTSILTETNRASTNPRSVGEQQTVSTLTDLLTDLLTGQHHAVHGLIAAHGAASTQLAASRFGALLHDALAATNLNCASLSPIPVLVTNDITVPLLSAQGPVCVVIAGTGTGFAARHGPAVARASGLEWLLTDEGGGHDLAVAGLRAAIRALDGRGPGTMLVDAARRWADRDDLSLPDALFEAVYSAHSKPFVATFAEHVLTAAAGGDLVAEALLDHAAEELAAGAEAVCRRCALSGEPVMLIVAGSLLTHAHGLRSRLAARLTGHLQLRAIIEHAATDRAAALQHLRRIWTEEPDTLTALATAVPIWTSTATTASTPMP